jgi:hypothetical protein
VVLAWIRRAAEGSIQVSNDNTQWQTIQPLPAAGGSNDNHNDDIQLASPPVDATFAF